MFYQWEYKVVRHDQLTQRFGSVMTDDDLRIFLDAMGADGWELVGYFNFIYIFKRPFGWYAGGS